MNHSERIWEPTGTAYARRVTIDIVVSWNPIHDDNKPAKILLSAMQGGPFSLNEDMTPEAARMLADALQHAANRVEELERTHPQGESYAG